MRITLPSALCKELGPAPGAKVAVERRRVGKETVWVLKGPGPDWSRVGSLRPCAKGKSHRLNDIRRSIARGWAVAIGLDTSVVRHRRRPDTANVAYQRRGLPPPPDASVRLSSG